MSNDDPGGLKHDGDKVRMDLLPIEALVGTAQVLTFGAAKYEDDNWRKGIKYNRLYGAALRHLTAWYAGEDLDPESGLSHLHHAGCCIAFLQSFTETQRTELDNRPDGPNRPGGHNAER